MTDEIITITETRTVNLTPIKNLILELEEQAGTIQFIEIDEKLSEEIQDLIVNENSRRELIKADILEQKRINEDKINEYNILTK